MNYIVTSINKSPKKKSDTFYTSFILVLFSSLLFSAIDSFAQVDSPNPDGLFLQDTANYQRIKTKRKESILKSDQPANNDLQISSTDLKYQPGQNKIKLENGLVLSRGDVQIQADQGQYDMEEQKAKVKGNVFFGWPTGSIASDSAEVDLETETGTFKNATLIAEESDFNIKAEQVSKVSEFDYYFKQPELSPCQCADGSQPWSITCSDLKVREEGYGKANDFRFKINQKTALYLPKVIFPFKRERQSGLLVPRFGYSNVNGTMFTIPYFYDVDDSTDLIIRPFTESRTRNGVAVDYNEEFSTRSKLASRFYFSDESIRDGENRGTNTDDLFDKTFDDQRMAGFLTHQWRNPTQSETPVTWNSNIHLVSDSLFLREFDDPQLGLYNSRFTTSRSVVRANIDPLLSAELSGEYNQAFQTDQDLIFQRAPEVNLRSQKVMSPLGQNLLGLKLVAANNIQAVNFTRNTGYEGQRVDLNPSLKIPYHYKNFLNGDLRSSYNSTSYSLDNNLDPADPQSIVSEDTRNVYTLSANVGTEVERVSDIGKSSPLTWLTSIGRTHQTTRLTRIKQTIEPRLTFTYVPDEDQNSLPLFDSVDRIRERQLVGMQARSSIYGKFEPINTVADSIPELAPEIGSVPAVSSLETLSYPGVSGSSREILPKPVLNRAAIRELASLSLYQTYNYLGDADRDIAVDDPEAAASPWSDLGNTFGLYPSNYLALMFDSNFNTEEQDFSSWGTRTHFYDDRGDSLRLRYSYLEEETSESEGNTSQLEGNIEILINERLRLGYYARYNESKNDFIDNQFALRISSECNCWDLDLGFRERINPNSKDFIATITLKGLGALNQGFSLLQDPNAASN